MLTKDASGTVVGTVETSIMKPFFLKDATWQRMVARLFSRSIPAPRGEGDMRERGKGTPLVEGPNGAKVGDLSPLVCLRFGAGVGRSLPGMIRCGAALPGRPAKGLPQANNLLKPASGGGAATSQRPGRAGR